YVAPKPRVAQPPASPPSLCAISAVSAHAHSSDFKSSYRTAYLQDFLDGWNQTLRKPGVRRTGSRALTPAWSRLWQCGVDAPLADALQLVGATVFEPEARAADEVPDCARDEHFAGVRKRRDACAGVDSDSADFRVDDLAFARVKTNAHFEIKLANRVDNRAGTPDGTGWPVEGGEEAVAGRVQLAAAKPGELTTNEGMMTREQATPGAIGQL